MLVNANNPNQIGRDVVASYHLSIEKLQQTISQLYQIDEPDEIDLLASTDVEYFTIN